MNGWPFKGESHCSRVQVVNCCSCLLGIVLERCIFYNSLLGENSCAGSGDTVFLRCIFFNTNNMAPVYDFRHVELDKIGRGKRIVKPPGGECSDIFGPNAEHHEHQLTPRKTKNYMQSNIFTPDSPDSPHSNGHTTPTTPSRMLDTQSRLFGASGDEETPRRIVNRQRSSIFEDEVVDSRPQSMKNTPARRPSINPITGTPIYENGSTNGHHNGSSNGSTPNGTSNGGTPNGHTNGYSNGHSSPESPMNGHGRVRNPPGGKSSGIF